MKKTFKFEDCFTVAWGDWDCEDHYAGDFTVTQTEDLSEWDDSDFDVCDYESELFECLCFFVATVEGKDTQECLNAFREKLEKADWGFLDRLNHSGTDLRLYEISDGKSEKKVDLSNYEFIHPLSNRQK